MKAAKAIIGYVRAIYEVARENQNEARYLEQLQQIAANVERQLLALVDNPAFAPEEKEAVLKAVAAHLELDKPMTAFFILLSQHGRLRHIGDIVELYRQMLYRAQGKRLMQIHSATELLEQSKQRIVDTFRQLSSDKLEVETEVDPELIGGIRVQIGSRVYDGSVRGRLEHLRAALLQTS